jgi:hypothetical protein
VVFASLARPIFCQDQVSELPLPDPEAFVQKVKENIVSDQILLRQYTYKETETVRELDSKGQIKKTEVKVYEVFPSWDEKYTYRRLVEKNGEPVEGKELEQQDRKHREKLEKRARKLTRKGASEREVELAIEQEERRKEKEAIDEVFHLYTVRPLKREDVDGFSTILFEFVPRPEYKAKTKELKFLKKIRGRAWICEDDYQIVRVEAETIENISFLLGILAKLHKGATLTFQRQRVNDEIWLPSIAHFKGKGRILLFKGLRIEGKSEFSDYQKFTVQSAINYAAPLTQ